MLDTSNRVPYVTCVMKVLRINDELHRALKIEALHKQRTLTEYVELLLSRRNGEPEADVVVKGPLGEVGAQMKIRGATSGQDVTRGAGVPAFGGVDTVGKKKR
jgi:hypothetical protein